MRVYPALGSAILLLALASCDVRTAENGERSAAASGKIAIAKSAAPTAKSAKVTVNGIPIHYLAYGDLNSGKTPLLVLHGSFMSAEAMAPISQPLAANRPVIALDQRGHGRSGGADQPLTYQALADDAAAFLDALKITKADVLGYSMGGTTAIQMAVRHPAKVGKLIPISGTYRRDGSYPQLFEAMQAMTPQTFAGSPMESEYKRLSPTPEAFPELVEKTKVMEDVSYDVPTEAVRAIRAKTMIIIGDSDIVTPEHATRLFKLRGGGTGESAKTGLLSEAPPARLAVLPGTSHIGIMGHADLIVQMVAPFLDDIKEPQPKGFF